MNDEEFSRRYAALAHAIQTGVAYDQGAGSQDGTPKHLRTGLNLVLCDHASLSRLLVEKGVISADEYKAAILRGLEEEKARYEARINRQYGETRIRLA